MIQGASWDKKKKNVPGNSKCKGSKAKAWPAGLRNTQEASVAARKSVRVMELRLKRLRE